jgi:predicted RNA-binding Zn ribbon-like protein
MRDSARLGDKAGRPALDLVATLHGRFGEPRDDLDSPDGARAWLSAAGLPVAGLPADGAERLRALREATFHLLGAVTGDSRPRSGDLVLLNRLAATELPAPRVRALGGRLVAEGADLTFDQVLGVFARDAAGLLTGPEADRLRQCEAESCGAYYLDTSRGGRRRWCSSASCGNRSRVAAHRDRSRLGDTAG